MTGASPLRDAHLMVYGFGPGADFEGRLVGALERVESGGALRILEALFVASDPESGELVAVNLRGDSGGIVAPLIGFRFEPAARRRATEKALSSDRGVSRETLLELGRALEPGAALVAVLVEHKWAGALEDAVSRSGGAPLANAFVSTTELAELAPDLLAAAARAAAEDQSQ